MQVAKTTYVTSSHIRSNWLNQKEWTDSPKVYGSIYIDDAGLGAPLKQDNSGAPPFIDWAVVAIHLFYYGCLTEQDII